MISGMAIPSDVEREVAVSFAAPDRIVKIALERVVEENALLRVGEVKTREGFNEHIVFPKAYVLRGPYSRIAAMQSDSDGTLQLSLPKIDLSSVEDTARPQHLLKRVKLPEGVSVLDEEGVPLQTLQVDVSVSFQRKGDYKPKTVMCPLDILLARWMSDKHVEILSLEQSTLNVLLELDSDSIKIFHAGERSRRVGSLERET